MASCVGVNTARVDTLAFALGSGIAGLAGCALSQIGNVGPDLGQSYIVDSFMVVVLGGVGQLAGTVVRGARPGRAEQAARRLCRARCWPRSGAGLHRHLHPEAAAGVVRDEGPERGSMSAVLPSRGDARTRAPRRADERRPAALAGLRGRCCRRGLAGVTIALAVVAVIVPIAQPARARRQRLPPERLRGAAWSARSCATRSARWRWT